MLSELNENERFTTLMINSDELCFKGDKPSGQSFWHFRFNKNIDEF
ncbi:hypothetical protein L291_2124 [Acinetobacter guillouiae MSP4-18]|nr:hypothetical protein L291_2124 [Acinetobacter guillouiae MSP4-18]